MTRTPEIKRRQREFRGGQIITKFKIAETTEWGRTVICNLGMGREREREREISSRRAAAIRYARYAQGISGLCRE